MLDETLIWQLEENSLFRSLSFIKAARRQHTGVFEILGKNPIRKLAQICKTETWKLLLLNHEMASTKKVWIINTSWGKFPCRSVSFLSSQRPQSSFFLLHSLSTAKKTFFSSVSAAVDYEFNIFTTWNIHISTYSDSKESKRREDERLEMEGSSGLSKCASLDYEEDGKRNFSEDLLCCSGKLFFCIQMHWEVT